MKLEIVNGSEEIVYRAEGVAEFELDHPVIGVLRLSAFPEFDVDVFEGCPDCPSL